MIFVDTSIWFAAANSNDADNARAKRILSSHTGFITSTLVLAETWRLLHHRLNWRSAEAFWSAIRRGVASLEPVLPQDYDAAWHIGQRFADQEFSLTDRTSFALMERLSIRSAAALDSDFAVYRYGKRNSEAFEILR